MTPSLQEYIGFVDPNCSNVDSLPTIYLQLGEHTVALPPQIYVARLKVAP